LFPSAAEVKPDRKICAATAITGLPDKTAVAWFIARQAGVCCACAGRSARS